MSSFIEDLERLDELDNLTQLSVLIMEIHIIQLRSIPPAPEWYIQRFRKIAEYAELDWTGMAHQFQGKNHLIHTSSLQILHHLHQLQYEWGSSPTFSLSAYAGLLTNINKLWEHYQREYIGEETDGDILDLIEKMTHMAR
jgi:hypothetical protein